MATVLLRTVESFGNKLIFDGIVFYINILSAASKIIIFNKLRFTSKEFLPRTFAEQSFSPTAWWKGVNVIIKIRMRSESHSKQSRERNLNLIIRGWCAKDIFVSPFFLSLQQPGQPPHHHIIKLATKSHQTRSLFVAWREGVEKC